MKIYKDKDTELGTKSWLEFRNFFSKSWILVFMQNKWKLLQNEKKHEFVTDDETW